MKTSLKTTVAAFTVAFLSIGANAQTTGFTDQVVSNLQDLGYEKIEVKVGPTQVKAEGVRGTEKIEIIYDSTTGEIIKQEQGAASDDEVGQSGVEIETRESNFIGDDGSEEDDDDGDDDGYDDGDDEGDDDDGDDEGDDDDSDDEGDDDSDDDKDDD